MHERRRILLRRLLAGMLVLLACALAVVLGWRQAWRLDEVYVRWAARLSDAPAVAANAERYFQSTLGAQLRMDALIPEGDVIFLGDSITQGLAVTAVAPRAVNLGIGQQTTGLMLQALPRYRALQRSGALVLTIGVNDVLHGQAEGLQGRLRQIEQALPAGKPLLWNAVMPLRGAGAAEANAALVQANVTARALCAARAGCRFLDTWPLFVDPNGEAGRQWLLEDGIHLSAEGYRRWIAAMKPELEALLNHPQHVPQN